MTKKELRKTYLQKRRSYDQEEIDRRSGLIWKNLQPLLQLTRYKTIHTFLPIQRHHEINTWIIIRELEKLSPEPKLVVSKSDPETGTMKNYYWEKNMTLKENQWGIPEPEAGVICPAEKMDLVLIPLLIFDLNGHRVGYGKGFYDRFLASCNPEALKAGLCLEGPVEQIDDVDSFDVKLDIVVNPDQVFWF